MCSRFAQSRTDGKLAADYSAEVTGEITPRFNTRITNPTPILVETVDEDGELRRKIGPARWSLVPIWVKKLEDFRASTHNARSEDIFTKTTLFRNAARTRRCAIPFSAYYEWTGPKGNKTPHAVKPADDMLFAGLWEMWRSPEGEDVVSCTILTGNAPETSINEPLHELHDRMPLGLTGELLNDWLKPEKIDQDEAGQLIEHVRAEAYDLCRDWQVYEVGPVKGEGPELLEPVGRSQ